MIRELFTKITERLRKTACSSGLGKKGIAAVAVLILGVTFLVMSEACEKRDVTEQPSEITEIEADNSAYIENLESRLVSIISAMNGVGRVKVMVTVASGSENIYLRDSNCGESRDKSGKSNVDRKDKYVIVDSENGENGIIVRVSEPKIRGVAVVCDGAQNESVKLQIIEAVTALLDISSAKVSVSPMG